MNNESRALLYLISCVLNEGVAEVSYLDGIDFGELYNLARFHNVSALVDASLKASSIHERTFSGALAMSVRRELMFDTERNAILTKLEQAGIWYMPLKGVILKGYYPGAGLREMSDNDILFDASRADDVRCIMETLGFSCVSFGERNVDDYQKPPLFHFEMHRSLFSNTYVSTSFLYEYYRDIENKLMSISTFEKRFTDEDFYIYLIAHEYGHFSTFGTGLRSLLDTYVYLRRKGDSLDWNYIVSETMKLGIRDFEHQNRLLAMDIFSPGANIDDISLKYGDLLSCFLRAGTYGSRENMVKVGINRSGVLPYISQRLFPPMHVIHASFPFFYKHKILLPFLPFYRLIHDGGWRKARTELKVLVSGARRGGPEHH